MDPNEISEYAREGMKWLILGGGSYIGALLVCQVYDCWPFQRKIESQEELNVVVQEEAEKLGLDSSKIDAIYNGITNGVRKNEERWELQLEGAWHSTRNAIRHELYHIAKGHCENRLINKNRLLDVLDYLFREEPQATLYGTFGIKL